MILFVSQKLILTLKLFFLFSFFSFFSKEALSGGAYVKGGTYAKGMGGAGRAGLDAYEGMLLNPALIKYSKSRSVALFGNVQKDSQELLPHSNEFIGFTLIDNHSDNLFSGGFSFFHVKKNLKSENSNFEELYFHFSLADIIYNRLIAGVSVYYLKSKSKIEDHNKRESYKQINGVWSLHYAPFDQFALSFVHYNFFSKNKKIPQELKLLHQISLGFQYVPMSFLRFRFDVNLPLELNDEEKLIYQIGLETFSDKLISFRIGSELNKYENKNFYTAGLSFNAPKFKLGFALKRNVKKNERDIEYGLDLKFSF